MMLYDVYVDNENINLGGTQGGFLDYYDLFQAIDSSLVHLPDE